MRQQHVLGHLPTQRSLWMRAQRHSVHANTGCSVCKGLARESKGLVLSGKGSQPPPPSRFISAIVIKALTKWFSCLSLLFNLLISYFSEVHYHPEAGNWELGLCGFSRLHLCFRWLNAATTHPSCIEQLCPRSNIHAKQECISACLNIICMNFQEDVFKAFPASRKKKYLWR